MPPLGPRLGQIQRNFTYNTNAIEGSYIESKEVKEILREDKWPEGKSREDIAETYGVAEAIDYIRAAEEHISLELIRESTVSCLRILIFCR